MKGIAAFALLLWLASSFVALAGPFDGVPLPGEPPPPLIKAAAAGDTQRIETLLNQGNLVDARDKRGYTALMAVLDKGEKPPSQAPHPGLPAMLYRATVNLLLARGADVNAKDNRSVTPLMLALANGYPDVVPLLLDRGADVNARDNTGKSPLMYASPQLPLIKMLLAKGAFVNARDDTGETPLSLSAESGSPEAVQVLLGAGAQNLLEAGTRAASVGNLATVKILLENIPEANSGKFFFATNLLLAAEQQGNTHATVELRKYLVNHGADVNYQDAQGWTPLIYAAYQGIVELAAFLLDHGADINAKDKQGRTALSTCLRIMSVFFM